MGRRAAILLAVWMVLGPLAMAGGAQAPGSGDINLNNNNAQGTYSGSNSNGAPNPGTALPPITRPEAEAMLGPSIPIINIRNPGLVFNSGDEVIRAAARTWKRCGPTGGHPLRPRRGASPETTARIRP